ncbi:MAG: AMP-binding protein [Proteobacteria bacterium]|nr:AMP-binding protein [Pseudomonadota bacterium]
MISVNERAIVILQQMAAQAEVLGVAVQTLSNGATVIDAGIKVPGSFAAGKLFAEACLGGLGEVGFADPFQPDMSRLLGAVVASGATSLILVPELLRGLIAAKTTSGLATPALDLVAVGGARVSPALLAAAAAAGLPVVEGYGLSECASVVAMNRPGEAVPGTMGRPLPHLQVSLAGDGEILIGPSPFLGYVGAPPAAETVATGDLGAFDADGRLSIVGRKSNTLITAFGRNVAPEWIESELLTEPEILQALVFGEAQADLGALIVPMPGRSDDAVAAAVARANARLPDYAHVRRWRRTPPFDPAAGQLTANGRPRRAVLLKAYADFVRAPEHETA